MKVTKVSCEVKFSKAVNEHSWKTVGLSAEAVLNGEDWQEAQKALYADLAAQLKEYYFSLMAAKKRPRSLQNSPQTPPGALSTRRR